MFGTHIAIRDLHLKDSAFWTVHPYASKDVVVSGLTITAEFWGANTDGVDPDSCTDVVIEDCTMRLGDDAVAIKSGIDQFGRDFNMPTVNVTIRNLTIAPPLDNLSTNGISIGSEMSGGVKDVFVSDVRISGVEAALFIKSGASRGGYVENVHFTNIQLNHTLQALKFSMDYPDASDTRVTFVDDKDQIDALHAGDYPPVFQNLFATNISGSCAQAGDFAGLPRGQANITGIRLQNIDLDADLGWQCANAQVLPPPASGNVRPKLPQACQTAAAAGAHPLESWPIVYEED